MPIRKKLFDNIEDLNIFIIMDMRQCRNPTLAKCGGEAQHLEKVRIWSPPGLPNI
jgi:hypothetical protein